MVNIGISIMIALVGVLKDSAASVPHYEPTIRSTIDVSRDSLTTEKAWTLDKKLTNPHRARWLLKRDVKAIGFYAVELKSKKGRFSPRAAEILSESLLFYRPAGPWYRDFSEFSCAIKPDNWFATDEGTKQAGSAGAEAWVKRLSAGSLRLGLLWERAIEPSAEKAIERGKAIFENWLAEIERDWQIESKRGPRLAEWRFYQERARHSGLCLGPGKKAKNLKTSFRPASEELLEEPWAPDDTTPQKSFLARAPARRWNGLYTVRVSIDIADKNLNGRFVIDSSIPISVLSPIWLKAQGINPALIEIPFQSPMALVWRGMHSIATSGRVLRATVSGAELPIRDFLVMEAELFGLPDSIGLCCDGVLGADFLKAFAVEFVPSLPSAIIIWDRTGFRPLQDWPWIEVSDNARGQWVSECRLAKSKSATATRPILLAWDTGDESALGVSEPSKLRCGSHEIARNIPVASTESSTQDRAGMALMGRGPFVIDLSHGRIWFEPSGLSKAVAINHSGLSIAYKINADRDRELRVKAIKKGTAADELRRTGLRIGDKLVRIDDQDSDEIDRWEVEQRLSGVYGDVVTLEWATTKGGGKKRRSKPTAPKRGQISVR